MNLVYYLSDIYSLSLSLVTLYHQIDLNEKIIQNAKLFAVYCFNLGS